MISFGMDGAIAVQIISLSARRDAASNYIMNQSMQIEVELLDAQIKALRELDKELKEFSEG